MYYNSLSIKEKVDEIFEQIVLLRRQLHMYPELGEQEVNTEKLICEELDRLDIPYQKNIAGHGVCATIIGRNPSRSVALRADMDALPLLEQTGLPYSSRTPGVMHGCGHDIHTAILLGTAQILNSLKENLPGSVTLLFQPSEETIGGAKQMIEAGCLENPTVSSVLGLHVATDVDVGTIQLIPGTMNAASCEFTVTVIGSACHGAHPTEGVDSLLAACDMVCTLQSIITRKVDPAEGALITVGQFHSGTKNNILSGETTFSGIIRTLNMANRTLIKKQMEQVCTSIASAHGATCRIEFSDSYPSLENDDRLLSLVQAACEEVLGKEAVIISTKPSLGADDFSYFCHRTRGLYYNLGARKKDGSKSYPLHSEHFNPDENCIKTGILSQVCSVFKILEEEEQEW